MNGWEPSQEDVLRIKRRLSCGTAPARIAADYGVSETTIGNHFRPWIEEMKARRASWEVIARMK